MDEPRYRHILETIERMTAIPELAAYRDWLRVHYHDAEELASLEQLIGGKVNELVRWTALTARDGEPPAALGVAPAATVTAWLEAIPTMDRVLLQSFARTGPRGEHRLTRERELIDARE